MTEKIITPDVYTTENDRSYIAPGQSTTGLAIIGPTQKGEAFIPTDVVSYGDFVAKFGSDSSATYVPQTVLNYLSAGSSVKVTRVLGNGGWKFTNTKKIAALVKPATLSSSGTYASGSVIISASYVSNGNNPYSSIKINKGDLNYFIYAAPWYDMGSSFEDTTFNVTYIGTSGSTTQDQVGQNFVTQINSNNYELSSLFSASYNSSTKVFTLTSKTVGTDDNNFFIAGGLSFLGDNSRPSSSFAGGSSSTVSTPGKILTVLHPSKNENASLASLNNSSVAGTNSSFNLVLSGSSVYKQVSASLDPTDAKYITKVLGSDASFQSGSAFPLINFKNYYSSNVSGLSAVSMSLNSANITFTSSFSEGYDNAKTPWILSDGGVRLFRIHHRSHGFKTNNDVKVSITNIKKSSVDSIYSTFNILVRKWDDTDRQPSILEQYINVSFNPLSANYIGRLIGDKYKSYDENQGKIIEHGNYPNVSNYIRLEISDAVEEATIPTDVIPNGFEAVYETISGFTGYTLPTASLVYSSASSFVYSGFDYNESDNYNYLNPIPLESTVGENVNFVKPSNDDKFTIPFQGGSDGMNYATIKKIGSKIATDGTNVFGFDLSNSTAPGTIAYNKAITILSNNQEYFFNLLAIPGVIEEYHPVVTALAESMVEYRTDAVYIRDLTGENTSITTAANLANALDSSYCATYYPWVKVRDLNSPKDSFVPPSVVVPQAYAYNDRVRAPWYAPAGVVSGVLGGVIEAKVKLNKADTDILYAAKINPITKVVSASGVAIMGQKTLQTATTALTRINVRRLMIELRGYISNVAKTLLFDQNTTAVRNSFLDKINPYLENVQQKEGIYGFKVVLDETNNPADVIDRNQLVCQIYIFPTKSIEYVLLEFNIEPTSGLTNFNNV